MPAYALKTETVGAVTYIGQAPIGSLPSQAVWRIKKVTDTAGNLDVQYVDGAGDWDSVWDNRASYTYI
jgi:hypothetical protein